MRKRRLEAGKDRILNGLARWFGGRRLSDSLKHLQEAKGSRKGKAVLVVGNGPSLKAGDLELTTDDAIGSNGIHKIFAETTWRPTMFSCTDRVALHNQAMERAFRKNPCLIYTSAKMLITERALIKSLEGDGFGFVFVPHRARATGADDFSSDLSRGFFGSGTVTFFNLQLCAHFGYSRIVLIGCDNRYPGEAGAVGESGHFSAGYLSAGQRIGVRDYRAREFGFALAANWAKRTGVEIVNASRAGTIPSIPQVELEEIL